jgi:hypothetical protein
MRRLVLLTAALAALAASVPAVAAAPARLQVVALEFEYRLSRPQLRAGPARIELVNLGEDEHDLRLRRRGGTRTYGLAKLLPGERRILSTRLRAGRYHLWCSLADHAARGMRATLRVRSPR